MVPRVLDERLVIAFEWLRQLRVPSPSMSLEPHLVDFVIPNWPEGRGGTCFSRRGANAIGMVVFARTMVRGGHKPYPPGSFDFLAAYVVQENAW